MIKTAVIGSRKIKFVSDNTFDAMKVEYGVSGGAEGVDRCFEDYCKRKGIPFDKHLPEYDKYPPKKAPLIRNEKIIDDVHRVIALWDGQSTGTMHAVQYARSTFKPVKVYLQSVDRWVRVD